MNSEAAAHQHPISMISGQQINIHDMLGVLLPDRTLRPVQAQVMNRNLLGTRHNWLICAPTNSGKSLVGLLALVDALARGRRGILLEPLRALAREKADELELLAPRLTEVLGTPVKIKISTGDYRLDDETYTDPAPGSELIVATPERLEALLRTPAGLSWLDTVGAVCVDEAHLLGNPHRGPTLEYLITTLIGQKSPPRIVLLSATLSNRDSLWDWLNPCQVVSVERRDPPLHKFVQELGPEDDPDQAIADCLREPLAEPGHQGLVFVYQTRSTGKLATALTRQLGTLAGSVGAQAYHAQMSPAERERVRQAFLAGDCRVVVTTSALALGINLPATHVVVRDLTYPNARSPDMADLLQMMGRAGRGDQAGHALVLKRPHDDWDTDELRWALEQETLPQLQSAFAWDQGGDGIAPAISVVASLLARRIPIRSKQEKQSDQQADPPPKTDPREREMPRAELESFLARSWGGRHLSVQMGPSLAWLERQHLAYQGEHGHGLTVLGERATRAVLPLPLAASYAQLIRDLLYVDPEDRLLNTWQPLDHLLVLNLLHDRTPTLRSFSEALTEQVEGLCERLGPKGPTLFRDSIIGRKSHSKAIELIGSLNLRLPKPGPAGEEWARRQAYLATFNALVIHERGKGQSAAELERRHAIKNLTGIEERWRDELLWLLHGIGRILELRSFYFHLKEECEADLERVRRVKRILRNMRQQVYDLQEQLKYCSPLGPLLRQIRNVKGKKAGIGLQTLRRLEEAGITSAGQIYQLGFEGLVHQGIRRDIAKRLIAYLRNRRI